MATTLAQLQNNVSLLLNEADPSNTDVGELASNNSSSPTQTTATTYTDLINKASAWLCRTCYALWDTATATYGIGVVTLPYSAFTCTGGGTLWAAGGNNVSWGTVPLPMMRRQYVNMNYPALLSDANGVSAYWYQDGRSGIGLVPKPSSSKTVTIGGYKTPALLVSGSDTASWISDDESLFICYAVAYLIAQKNIEDQNLQIKLQPWRIEWQAAKQRLWASLAQQSNAIATGYFSAPASIDEMNDQTASQGN